MAIERALARAGDTVGKTPDMKEEEEEGMIQEADGGVCVHQEKRGIGPALLQPPAFCRIGTQYGFLEFGVRKIVQAAGPQGSW